MKNIITKTLLFVLFLTLVTALLLYKVILISNIPGSPTFWTFYGIIATVFLVTRIPYAYLYKDNHNEKYNHYDYPDVSVIIAVKNEEDGIFKTIATCLESDYTGDIECIVIDDGSTDNTRNEILRAQKYFGKDIINLIIFPVNKGKREAMAAGISESKNEIIIFVDSDSFLAKDAMTHITEHFLQNEKIGAVSGNTKVENRKKNLLTRMQSIQYSVSFNIYKASESVHKSVTCCPGCFSAYRKIAIEPLVEEWKTQRFLGSVGTFGDDRGLTNFVLKKWDIVYCQNALATTVAPEKFRVYLKQQLRWKKSWIREGVFASIFMWKKRHPLASFAFYTNFTFPIVGPILAGIVLYKSIITNNPLLFLIFISGFIILGLIFSLFTRIYLGEEDWIYMPFVSILFIFVFMWQMPWALLTLKKTHWGTR